MPTLDTLELEDLLFFIAGGSGSHAGLSAAGEAMEHSDFNHDEMQPAFVLQDVGALMLKLKDTNTAIKEVIQLSDIVENHMVRDTVKLIEIVQIPAD